MSTRREGFAIPLSIMVIGFLSISLMAAFARVDNDYNMTNNRTLMVDAYSLAQTGLETFIARRRSLGFTAFPPAASESTRIALTGGYADVILRQVRDTVGGLIPLYVIRSRGTTTPPAISGYRPATHTVAIYSSWRFGSMDVYGGWTSLSGLEYNGNSATLSGVDNCHDTTDVAGVAVPDGLWDPNVAQYSPTGTPPVDEMGTKAQMAATIDIDWAGITSGQVLDPDILIPPSGWPSSFPANWWPVIYVDQASFSLPTDGRGTLVVTGDLTIGGSRSWDGIILVGGRLVSNGNNHILGTTITGLNVKLAQNPNTSTLGLADAGNGTKIYQYDSCNVRAAMARFGTLVPLHNTWIDNWAW